MTGKMDFYHSVINIKSPARKKVDKSKGVLIILIVMDCEINEV
jgi:hypothetical protein